MKQTAIVKEVVNDKALLLIKRQTMCDGCHKEGGCHGCSQIIEVTVDNTLYASAGDTVQIETPGATVIGVSALVFFLPLMLAFAAYFTLDALGLQEGFCYLGALLAPVICYTVIAIVVRRSRKTLKVTMTQVLTRVKEIQTEGTPLQDE